MNIKLLLSIQTNKIFYPPGDGLSRNNGMEFSTFDNDNDALSGFNCAAELGGAGNWWGNCGRNSINGKYGGNGYSGGRYMWWYHFDNNDSYMSLESMSLMFRHVD